MDKAIGTLVDSLKSMGVLDNTLILVMADNGANAEAGPDGELEAQNCYLLPMESSLRKGWAGPTRPSNWGWSGPPWRTRRSDISSNSLMKEGFRPR